MVIKSSMINVDVAMVLLFEYHYCLKDVKSNH